MSRSIPAKFLALVLAALALLTAVGSGFAIVGLVAADLYENSVEELYSSEMQGTRQNFAVNLAHRYASLHLGSLPEQYLNDYYGITWLYNTFQYGTYYYTIRNEHGDVVESTMEDAPEGGTHYEMAVTNIRYRVLVEVLNSQEAYSAATTDGEPVQNSEPAESIPDSTLPDTAQEPEAASGEARNDNSSRYSSDQSTELIRDSYYDSEQEQMVEFLFTYADLPPYTVDLYLMPGAMPEEFVWTLVRQIWAARYTLFYYLGGSLLVFAVCMVFLCCVAGRKKGQPEPRAAGLNCIPLDLYLALAGGNIAALFFFGMEGARYLLRYSPKILIPYGILVGFVCCLIFVGYCFACAAQFKMPGSYWWCNSLTGRCIRLSFRFAKWTENLLGKHIFPGLGHGIKVLWNFFVRSCVGIYRLTEKLLMWLFPVFLVKVCRTLWRYTVKLVLWVYHTAERLLTRLFGAIGRFFRWLGRNIARYFDMMPLMWQWLITGFAMLLVLVIALLSRSEMLLVIGICLCLAIVLYGAGAFGLLLESTKRMGKGDLDTRVSDQYMTGSFKEFARDLNSLADVAVIAAQKQLKSERMKTELITNVSHDIKTPLTSIINYVDLLQKPHTDEEQEIYLEVLSRQSLRLKKLIEDLMEMSKASTGNMAVDIITVNATEAVNQALGEFSDKLEKIRLTTVFTPPEEPVCMYADGRLTWRVLGNLLSNICKYALPGTRLYIDLTREADKVVISLKNISRQSLNVSADELLERFVRGDTSRNTEGSGLGLNIAKSLMELQKGQLLLTVDGDLFKVTLVFPGADTP